MLRTLLTPILAIALIGGTSTGLLAVQTSTAPPAAALDNGLALTPPMGFNDWNAFGCSVDQDLIEQTADAMVHNGMKAAGYQYVNIDDCWALPQRDADSNLVPDPAKFPEGIKAVADYVHDDGLKLGIYEDSGTKTCSSSHGFPGSLGHEDQDALLFATWGVDYLKDDDCNQPADQQNIPATIKRYEAMRDALAKATEQTGHRIVFSICEKTDFGVPNSAWPQIGNLWRTTGDIHDQYSRMVSLFHTNVQLADLAKPGAWNDPDMLEIGNGGQTDAEYRSEFSLWSEMAAPLIAGTDLRDASPGTLAIYTNSDVIAVDQDPLGKQGTIVSSDNGHWVLTKPLADGDVAVTLFNETDSPAVISTDARAAGAPRGHGAYALRNLWTHRTTETAGTISADVAPHSTVMYRVSAASPVSAPPDVLFTLSGLDDVTPGQTTTVTESFTDHGVLPALALRLSLAAPDGWTVRPIGPTKFGAVSSGHTARASWHVGVGPPADPFGTSTVTGTARYRAPPSSTQLTATAARDVSLPTTVSPPYHTVSATSPGATFGQADDRLGIRAAGQDVYGATNQYGAIYLPGAEQDGTVDAVQLTAQSATSDWAKSGIMVRNDINQSASSPGFVILAASPGHGYVLQWDADGDGRLDSSSAPSGQGTGTTTYPSWLKLTRDGTTFTGYYSPDGTTWTRIASAEVPSAAGDQDAGVFSTAHSTAVGEADFAKVQIGPPGGLVDAPRTAVTPPGQATKVTAAFWNHGSASISDAALTLSAPAGWTVAPSGATLIGAIAAGSSGSATWQVMPPVDATAGATPLEISATYAEAGHAAQSRATVSAVVPSTDLSSAYNNVGVTDDDDTGGGNIDGAGSSLSAQALAAVGVTPGSAISAGGLQFAWPNAPTGQPDNVVAAGQSFQISGGGSTLGFLATSTYGPASGTATINYSDGSTQQVPLTVPDWYSDPPSGSTPAITMSYRNRSGNTQQTHDIHVFLVTVPLPAGKTVSGVTLPDVGAPPTSGTPAMHVFGIAVG